VQLRTPKDFGQSPSNTSHSRHYPYERRRATKGKVNRAVEMEEDITRGEKRRGSEKVRKVRRTSQFPACTASTHLDFAADSMERDKRTSMKAVIQLLPSNEVQKGLQKDRSVGRAYQHVSKALATYCLRRTARECGTCKAIEGLKRGVGLGRCPKGSPFCSQRR